MAVHSDIAEYNIAWALVYSYARFTLMKSLDIDYRDQQKLAKEMWRNVKLEDLNGKREHTWTELDQFLRKLFTSADAHVEG